LAATFSDESSYLAKVVGISVLVRFY